MVGKPSVEEQTPRPSLEKVAPPQAQPDYLKAVASKMASIKADAANEVEKSQAAAKSVVVGSIGGFLSINRDLAADPNWKNSELNTLYRKAQGIS